MKLSSTNDAAYSDAHMPGSTEKDKMGYILKVVDGLEVDGGIGNAGLSSWSAAGVELSVVESRCLA